MSARHTLGYIATPTTPDPPCLPGVALVVALVLAFVAIAGVVVFYRDHGPAVHQTSTPPSPAAPAPQADDSSLLDHDGQLFLLLTQQGLRTSGARDITINEAHHVCDRLAGGESEQQIIQDILVGSPGMSAQTAAAFADIAISVYCPQD